MGRPVQKHEEEEAKIGSAKTWLRGPREDTARGLSDAIFLATTSESAGKCGTEPDKSPTEAQGCAASILDGRMEE